jgi:hypothetical protein
MFLLTNFCNNAFGGGGFGNFEIKIPKFQNFEITNLKDFNDFLKTIIIATSNPTHNFKIKLNFFKSEKSLKFLLNLSK